MIDVILRNGTIITMSGALPRTQAILFRGRHVVTTGTIEQCRAACVDAEPTEIDIAGRAVVPGFNDAHLHLVHAGMRSRRLMLDGMDRQQILAALEERAATLPAGEPLRGYGWDYEHCPDPTKDVLDRAFPDRPVILTQFSGHGAWVNSAALRALGVTQARSEWDGGGADIDGSGRFTGILREPHYAPGYRRMLIKESRNAPVILDGIREAMKMLTALGVTSVGDNTWYPWHVDRIADLYHRGEQTVRVNCWSWGARPWWEFRFDRKAFRDEWYERGAHKFFADGAFSSHTAWLTEPYADKPGTAGSGSSAASMLPFVRTLSRRGGQIAIHAIGDAAVAAFVDAVDEVSRETGIPMAERRHRIEHGQLIRAQDIERIKRLGLLVSAQPHAAGSPEKDKRLLGEERALTAYPFRSLLDAGVPLVFSSDFPGESTVDPLYGIHLAVNREGPEAISAEEALAAYTTGGAYAEFAEDKKGALKPGYLADMAVLSADPTRVDPAKIREITVDATLVDGNLVYIRDGVELGTVRGVSTSCQPSAAPAERGQTAVPAASAVKP